MRRAWAWGLITLLILCGAAAWGHAFRPALLLVHEHPDGTVLVTWHDADGTEALVPELPASCQPQGPPAPRGDAGWQRRYRCDPLRGARIAVRGFAAPGEQALVQLTLAEGQQVAAVLRGAAPALDVPARRGPLPTLRAYLGLGARHILSGADHLLLLLALVLLVRGARRLFFTITSFTAAHGLTLSLASLGALRLPPQPVEVLIALSVVFLALDLAEESGGAPRPFGLAFAFGLLHGLGFAGALGEVGLPDDNIPLALCGFNLGVEAGQLLFVAAVLLLRAAARRLVPRLVLPRWTLAYGIGGVAALWCLQRTAVLLHLG